MHGENASTGVGDLSTPARRANAKLQRIENARATQEGRAPVNLREAAIAVRRAQRLAREATRAGAVVTEYAYADEAFARQKRRDLIIQGASVSLLSFDPSRGLYAFDFYPNGE